MAKSSRAKKLKRAEKAKVKFKVGKPKPKGLNVTDTSFKSKKVVIQEQLKETNEPTTKKNLNLKDLLQRLTHYNTSVKLDAISGLQELLASNRDVQWSRVIGKIAPLMTDTEAKVRERLSTFLKNTLPLIPRDTMLPHFHLLSTHLCCAITHIHPDIQQDSLKVFDLLIDMYPDFMVANSTVLKHFLQQISNLGKSKFAQGSRMGLASHSWRLKVLMAIHKLLIRTTATSELENEEYVHEWRPSEEGSHCCVRESRNVTDVSVESEQITTFISTLVPMIYDTWIEVMPRKQRKDVDASGELNAEALNTLHCITEILKKFWVLIRSIKREDVREKLSSWFLDNYSEDFRKLLLHRFPYSLVMASSHSAKRAKKQKSKEPQLLLTTANLNMCSLGVAMRLESTDVSAIPEYLVEVLSQDSSLDLKEVVAVVEAVMNDKNQEKLLEALYNKYNRMHHLQKDRNIIEQFFLNQQHCGPIQKWIDKLPEELLKESVTPTTIRTIHQVAIRSHPSFLRTLQENFPSILGNLDNIKWVRGNGEGCEKMVLQMLLWIPEVTLDITACKDGIKNASYMQSILNERSRS